MTAHSLGWYGEGAGYHKRRLHPPTLSKPSLYNLAPSALCTSGAAYPQATGLVRAAASGATKGDRCSSRSVQKTGCRFAVSCTGSGAAGGVVRAGPGRGGPAGEPANPDIRASDGQDPGTILLGLSGSVSLPLGGKRETPVGVEIGLGLRGTAGCENVPRAARRGGGARGRE
jgi:hypothetical protein